MSEERCSRQDAITYTPIGVVRSPFTELKGMPIQPLGARGIQGTVEIRPELAPGLADLEGFSHLFLIVHFHLARETSLQVTPFLDDTPRGLFSTRAPNRLNPIGISVVRLDRIDGATLHVSNVDILDGTPLLDIKPFVPHFDAVEDLRTGWLSQRSGMATEKRSDQRFTR